MSSKTEPDDPPTTDLPAGTRSPHPGKYVVLHRDPAHAVPHEVRIAVPMLLPKCNACADVRFSLQRMLVEPIEDNEFFRLCSAKMMRQSCSMSQSAILVVKSVQDGVRHDSAWPVESMPMALPMHVGICGESGRPGPNEECGRPRL
jgi:hypothetical protein